MNKKMAVGWKLSDIPSEWLNSFSKVLSKRVRENKKASKMIQAKKN